LYYKEQLRFAEKDLRISVKTFELIYSEEKNIFRNLWLAMSIRELHTKNFSIKHKQTKDN
jgi:hypothetical protein